MPRNRVQSYLICYDIAEPRRLGRVHRFLTKEAVPVQYSVFNAVLSPFELEVILDGLEELIDPDEDDVRVYPLPARPRILSIGQGYFPDGITLVDRGKELIQPAEAA